MSNGPGKTPTSGENLCKRNLLIKLQKLITNSCTYLCFPSRKACPQICLEMRAHSCYTACINCTVRPALNDQQSASNFVPVRSAINAECSLGNHALIQSISLSEIKQGFDALPLENSSSSCSLFSSPQNLNE